MTERRIPMTERMHSRRQVIATLVAAGAGGVLASGCSLFVMAGKMLSGDPHQDATFKAMTGEDLTKGKKSVLVICNTPTLLTEELATLRSDLSEGLARRMRRNKVKVIDPERVALWIDEHAGEGVEPQALAQDFDADYIVVVDVQYYSLRAPNSPKLLQGNAHGFIRAYKVQKDGGSKFAAQVFTTEFTSTHPRHAPISEIGRSPIVFQQEFKDEFCDEIARNFYDHRPGLNI